MVTTDGRDTRWAGHREARRRALVEDTLRAIRRHGAGVGMDEIAAQAGTSKTVIYRHFGDRAGLYAAVVASVHDFIHHGLETALVLTDPEDLSVLARDLADAYLEPRRARPGDLPVRAGPAHGRRRSSIDPYGGLPELIGDHVSRAIAAHLQRGGQDPSCAPTWGHGVVGFIRAAADQWMAAEDREPKAVVLARLDAFFTPALATGLAAVPQLQEQS